MYEKICVVVSNSESKEFFISDEHDSYDLPGFVPATHYSHTVFRTKEKIESIQEVINFYYDDYKNIDLLGLYPSL
jgi:hypothetical protein